MIVRGRNYEVEGEPTLHEIREDGVVRDFMWLILWDLYLVDICSDCDEGFFEVDL